jgi:hypothetical protein
LTLDSLRAGCVSDGKVLELITIFLIKHYLPVSSTSIYFVFAKRKPR